MLLFLLYCDVPDSHSNQIESKSVINAFSTPLKIGDSVNMSPT